MTTQQVANRLVELCRQGKIDQAQNELFDNDAVSIESNESMGPMEIKGLAGIKEKSQRFDAMLEHFYSATISDPVIAGNWFSIAWDMDAQMKGQARMLMSEICVYKVDNGKIISEQFFF